MNEFEQNIQQSLFQSNSERTFIDKLLAKDDINNIRKIIKKKRLTREDMLDILYMLSGSEVKLVNLGEWDRYVILKFFVWIREHAKIAEQLYDYKDKLKNKKTFKITERTEQYIENNLLLLEHNIKFLVDLYFNILRSSLSIGATGFLELLKNKYEMVYDGNVPGTVVNQEKKPLLSMRR